MKFIRTKIHDVYIIELEVVEDDRGFFTRSYCKKEFENQGIKIEAVQTNISFNLKMGTLRGLHYQQKPLEESKIVRCNRGSIWDVFVDIRNPGTSSFGQWDAVKLTQNNNRMVYIPEGCAHGFITLEDDTEVFYLMSEYYDPKLSSGIKWDDPTLSIEWPLKPTMISKRDSDFPYINN